MSCWRARPSGERRKSQGRRRPITSRISSCMARCICWATITRRAMPMPSAWRRWSGASWRGWASPIRTEGRKRHAGGIHRPGHDGLGHLGQYAQGRPRDGGARCAAPGGREDLRGRRRVGRFAQGRRRGDGGGLHLVAGTEGIRSRRARRQGLARRHVARPAAVRSHDQFADRHPRPRAAVRRTRRRAARQSGERRPGGRPVGQDGDLGRRRRAGLPALSPGARLRQATRSRISGRSARPRSPSWCTISAAT